MVDLTAPVRHLYRRLVGRKPEPGTEHPGREAEADGLSAAAALEAWLGDGAVFGLEPSSALAGERFTREAAEGPNLFHRPARGFSSSSGRGALAMAMGLASSGQRASAFLAGCELDEARDLLAEAARRRLPLVVHLVARGPETRGTDHRTLQLAGDCGAVVLMAADVQEVADLTAIGRRLAEEALVPVVLAMDGETAHGLQDLVLPETELLSRFLGGPGELVHPPSPAQEMLFGQHRRRVPRWHDPARPLASGVALDPEAAATAGFARQAFFDGHLLELWRKAAEEFSELVGRRYDALRTHGTEGARFLWVSRGSSVELAEAVAAHLRGARLGTVGCRLVRPMPEADWLELLEGRRAVAVIERGGAPLVSEGPWAAELRALLTRGADRGDLPRLVSIFAYGPPRAADLEALGRELSGGEVRPGPIHLGLATDGAGADYPRRQALLDTLERHYPGWGAGALRASEPAPELRPEGAFTFALVRRDPAPAAESHLGHELGVFLRRLLGGHLRCRTELGWGARPTETLHELVTWSPSPLADPGPDAAPEITFWLPGVETSATGVERQERMLGAILAALHADGRFETTLRKLLRQRRELLEERGAEDVESRLDAFEAGFEGAGSEAPRPPMPPADGPPPAVRALGRGSEPLADLAAFWGRTGVLYRDGAASRLAPDPFLATATVPQISAALADLSPGREMLPAFDPDPCTGCGECWSVCPEGAVVPAPLHAATLLEEAMARARSGPAPVDKLRMIASKLAQRVQREAALPRWAGGEAGELFEAAFTDTLEGARFPEERQAELREAFAAVRRELEGLPLARTELFFDGVEAKKKGAGELLALAIDPDACTGCGLCAAVCEPDALVSMAGSSERTAVARKLHRSVAELPVSEEAAAGLGDTARSLLMPGARAAMVGGGAEPGSGPKLALRQVVAITAHHTAEITRAQLEGLEVLRGELAEAIHGTLAGALPDRDLDALASGLDELADRPDADLAELTARIETAFENERVDVGHTRRLVAAARAVADLAWSVESGESGQGRSPLGLVLDADPALVPLVAFPHNPFRVPVTVAWGASGAELARGLLEGQLREAAEAARVMRRARLELSRPAGPRPPELARAMAELDRLEWRELEGEERHFCPPLWWVTSERALAGSSLGRFFELLSSDLPLKVLILAEVAHAPAWDLEKIVPLAPGAFLARTALGQADHLGAAVAEAAAFEGPAVVEVLAPSPSRHGEAADAALEISRRAVEEGSWRLFRSDRRAPETEPAPAAEPVPVPDTAALEARHHSELAALRSQYERQIANLRAGFGREMAQKLRARLLSLATTPKADDDPREARP